jgi:hypothetical protein
MILGVRILLIALLLVGSTGSALCQALCAQPPDSQTTAQARSAEAAPPHAGCHGGGVTSPEPLSDRSGESCQDGCCTVLTRATAAPISIPGPTSTASPMLAGVGLYQFYAGLDLLSHSRPAERLKLPFRFRNPPLLI